MLLEIPEAIANAAMQFQKKMGWPDSVPRWAFMPPNGTTIKNFCNLTVSDCEELVEYNVRLARDKIAKYQLHQSKYMARKAGEYIILARLYRCQYITLIGSIEGEVEMPFPCMTHDDAGRLLE